MNDLIDKFIFNIEKGEQLLFLQWRYTPLPEQFQEFVARGAGRYSSPPPLPCLRAVAESYGTIEHPLITK